MKSPLNVERGGDTKNKGGVVLITDAFELYRKEVILFTGQSRKTEEHHRVAMLSFLKITGNIPIKDVTFEEVRRWKERMDSENKSVQTIRGYLIKLRVVLAHCLKNGIETLNPDLIPLPKRITRPPHWVSPAEVQTLIDSTKKLRNKAIIALLYASGIRVSELCRLNRDDIRNKKFTVLGKGEKYRLAFIDDRADALIRKYLKTRKDSNPALFIQRVTGKRIHKSGVEEIFRRACKNSGLCSVTPHTLRHSFATNLLENGMAIHSLSRLMGHSNIATTSIYLHVTYPQLEQEYNKHHTV
jgi:integrase/recombinase XerD